MTKIIPIQCINVMFSFKNTHAAIAVNTYARLSNGYIKLTFRVDMAPNHRIAETT